MVKKSHKAAAKYSELSKSGKKKQRDKGSIQTVTVSTGESQVTSVPGPAKSTVSTTSTVAPRIQPGSKRVIQSYQHVRTDLKMIGILAGMMMVVLIVLTFVLG